MSWCGRIYCLLASFSVVLHSHDIVYYYYYYLLFDVIIFLSFFLSFCWRANFRFSTLYEKNDTGELQEWKIGKSILEIYQDNG